ncbi:MAG TPA: hypothetical protein VGC41_26140, partial [Kofleriaceae bacterium]
MKALWVVIAGCSRAAVIGQPGDTAIVDVTLVPMTSDAELPHQTVVIRGDAIVAIAPASATLAREVKAIDGRGKWLMPGLADMHVHTWRPEDLTMFVAAGVTTIRNMWGTPLHLAWRRQIAAGRLFGPTIITSGNLIDGKPAAWPGSFELEDPGQADSLVTTEQAAGYDFVKVVNKLTRPAYEALVHAAEAHHRDVAGHVPWAEGLAGVLAAHQHSVEHLDGVLDVLVPNPAQLPAAEDDAWVPFVLANADLA